MTGFLRPTRDFSVGNLQACVFGHVRSKPFTTLQAVYAVADDGWYPGLHFDEENVDVEDWYALVRGCCDHEDMIVRLLEAGFRPETIRRDENGSPWVEEWRLPPNE